MRAASCGSFASGRTTGAPHNSEALSRRVPPLSTGGTPRKQAEEPGRGRSLGGAPEMWFRRGRTGRKHRTGTNVGPRNPG